ncbi:hypothetical protein [Streptomyces shaanxiensis]|uniref:hypothetical protein n=1 Tax=Streptomyces shaanxiensis TaxID=653357 RepID=UPI0031E8D4C7
MGDVGGRGDEAPGGANGLAADPPGAIAGPTPAEGFSHGDPGGTASRGSDGTSMGGPDAAVR